MLVEYPTGGVIALTPGIEQVSTVDWIAVKISYYVKLIAVFVPPKLIVKELTVVLVNYENAGIVAGVIEYVFEQRRVGLLVSITEKKLEFSKPSQME